VIKTPRRITEEVKRSAGKGVAAAAYFYAARVKEVLSVPAPRASYLTKRNVKRVIATTRATPGAPPRKLTGRLRASISVLMLDGGRRARVGTNVIYARRHELGTHPFLMPTLRKHLGDIQRIIRGKP
jgi:phage gpG-like protein